MVAVCLALLILVPLPSGSPHSSTATPRGSVADGGSLVNFLSFAASTASRVPPHAAMSVNPAGSGVSNCSQGTQYLPVVPVVGNNAPTLLADFNLLGSVGGGTLLLAAGTYTLDQPLSLQKYSNVSIQGAGVGRTILSMPPDPVGTFTALNGTPLGLYNLSVNGPVNGTTANLVQLAGPLPINNFALCDLTLRANANNASEDWSGSLLFDGSGGSHHVYSDLAETDLFGPSTEPNGIHLDAGATGATASDYLLDNLTATNNTLPFENYPGFNGGPNFLNIGNLTDCDLENVSGIGQAAFEVAPTRDCLIANWNVRGHITIDPSTGGTWGGTLFQNVTTNSTGTPSSYTLTTQVSGASSGKQNNFTDLRWNDDTFVGDVVNGANMLDVENSTFVGGLNETPAVFLSNTLVWPNPNHPALPIRIDGSPTGGSSALLADDTFEFPNGTHKVDPFELTVPSETWTADTFEIGGPESGYVVQSPNLTLVQGSGFSGLVYDPLSSTVPAEIELFDLNGSPGFIDLGIAVWNLTRIDDDLPQYVPSPPSDLIATAVTSSSVALSWQASIGPLTSYTLLIGSGPSNVGAEYSVGTATHYLVPDLDANASYYFAVEAWNGSRVSPRSAPLWITTSPATEGGGGSFSSAVDVVIVGGAIGAGLAVVIGLRSSGRLPLRKLRFPRRRSRQ